MKTRVVVHSLCSFTQFYTDIILKWFGVALWQCNDKNITFAERNHIVLNSTFKEMRALTVYGVDWIHDPPLPPDIFTAAVWNMKGRRVFVLKKVNADPSGCGPLGWSINKVLWGETFPQDPTRYSLVVTNFIFSFLKDFISGSGWPTPPPYLKF